MTWLCGVLGISRSAYYRSKGGEKEASQNEERSHCEGILIKLMEKIKTQRPYYGYRRMCAWLRLREGVLVNRKKVYRLMKENGLLCTQKRYKAKRRPERNKPRAEHKNQWWGIDMTKFLINKVGWIYLVVVIDWYTKKLIGYQVSQRSRSQEWKEALEMAVDTSCPKGSREYEINLMSDNGTQPTSIAFMKDCAHLNIKQSFTSYDNPKGNADTERVIKTLKEECIWLEDWESFQEAVEGVKNGIKEYNRDHLHSSLKYLSPDEFESQLEKENVLNIVA